MDFIVLAVIGIFIFLLYRKKKKNKNTETSGASDSRTASHSPEVLKAFGMRNHSGTPGTLGNVQTSELSTPCRFPLSKTATVAVRAFRLSDYQKTDDLENSMERFLNHCIALAGTDTCRNIPFSTDSSDTSGGDGIPAYPEVTESILRCFVLGDTLIMLSSLELQ